LSDFSRVEKELIRQLSNPASEAFQSCETAVLARLVHLIERNVDAWQQLNSYDLFLAATKGDNSGALKKDRNMLLENIARIAAHAGILHWKIWGKIAYAVAVSFDPRASTMSMPAEHTMPLSKRSTRSSRGMRKQGVVVDGAENLPPTSFSRSMSRRKSPRLN
jgi:hypothetical protein